MKSKISVLAAIILIFACCRSAAAADSYEFVKLVLRWPPSYCNAILDDNVCRRHASKLPFVISDFEPMYYEDTPLLPYNEGNPCVDQVPVSTDFVTRDAFVLKLLAHILDNDWPYLRIHEEGSLSRDEEDISNWGILNVNNWKHKWHNNGKCYKYPKEPVRYFTDALYLYKMHGGSKMLGKFAKEGITASSDGNGRPADEFSVAVQKIYSGKIPQIRCNEDRSNKKQLVEIGLCFNKNLVMEDCEKKFEGCVAEELIRFPPAAAAAA